MNSGIDGSTRRPSSYSTTRWLLALCLVIGLLLRLWALSAKAVWLDEIWSITVARMPLGSIFWSMAHHDPNMSLYHLLLHFWLLLGSADYLIRALSALFGAATIPVVYRLARETCSPNTALLAALLFAINLFHIQYSQEARSYSLWVLLCTLATLLLARAVELLQPRIWVFYCIVSVLALYAHIYTGLLLVAHLTSVLLLPRRPPARYLSWAAGALGIGAAPLLVLGYQRARHPFVPLDWVPRPSVRRIYDVFYALSGNANFYGIEVNKLPTGKLILFLCLAAALLAIVHTFRAKDDVVGPKRWKHILLLLCLLVPLLLALVISVRMPLFLNRYFLICVPALCILTAQGFRLMRPRWMFLPILGLFLACEGAALVQYYHYRADDGEWRTATASILSRSRPGDAIVFCNAHGRLLFDFYKPAGETAAPEEVYPTLDHTTDDPSALSYYPPASPDQLASLTRHPRVWLVLYPDPLASSIPLTRTVRATLANQFQQRDSTHTGEVAIELYSSPGTGTEARLTTPLRLSQRRPAPHRP